MAKPSRNTIILGGLAVVAALGWLTWNRLQPAGLPTGFTGDPSLDHNFCLSRARGTLRDVLWLTGRGGLTLTLATTEPGVQVYDGRDAIRPLRGRYEGLALEPQFWPDALSHPHFPSILLAPGQAWQQQTRWRFSR